ncbi:hypothetical protein NC652_000280 [Populus alba x Populus x berolinensis]|nr:hypothetical protein NC652_000280 [Populus alba x Populus x berolinensis]
MVSGGWAGQEDNADHHHLEATLPVRILMLTLPIANKKPSSATCWKPNANSPDGDCQESLLDAVRDKPGVIFL